MADLVGREFAFEVEADLDWVWQALATSEGLATWYVAEAEVDARPGGELKVDWGAGPHAMGTFDVVDAPHRLRLVYGGSEVGVEEWLLSHAAGVTTVRLIHSLPLDEDATWDETYGDITRGWSLFFATLQWTARAVGNLGRSSEVRTGTIGDGAWDRILAALDLDAVPAEGTTLSLDGLPPADVLRAVDGYSLLLALGEEATLLIDVEGNSLYTLAATYGDVTEHSATVLHRLVALAERLCAAAG